MKKALLIIAFIAAIPASVCSGSKDIQKGLQLYRKHHYHDAVRLMHSQLAGKPSGVQTDTRRNFGMACLANAQFYDRLHQAAKPMLVEYLKRLVQADDQRKSTPSRLAKLYLGKALQADGQSKRAITVLTDFLERRDIGEADRHDASIALGAAYHATGQKALAESMWSKVPEHIPHAAALLAAAYQQAGVHVDKITPMADGATAALLADPEPIPVECTSALLVIYGRHNRVSKGFEVLAHTRLETFAREEVIDAHKVLRFYDASLLRNLSSFYSQAAISALNEARKSTDARIAITAVFLAGEAYAFSHRMSEASRAMDELLASAPPKSLSRRAIVRQAAYGSHSQSDKKLETFLTEKSDVAQVTDIIMLCTQLGVDCPAAIKLANRLWRQAMGRPPAGLGMALGRYYRARKDHGQTLLYLEAARDKSRKNRIEANPPAMLADLAWAYYKNRQFSEALEIYFNMSKQFPAVRQIQAALQGIYSMEQQSAGDAKIF